MDPSTGPVGTRVTIRGSGFGASNTVFMNGLVNGGLKNIPSADGVTLSFNIPAELGPDCKPNEMCAQFLVVVRAGNYTVSVVSNGVTQKIGIFTVTGNGTMQ